MACLLHSWVSLRSWHRRGSLESVTWNSRSSLRLGCCRKVIKCEEDQVKELGRPEIQSPVSPTCTRRQRKRRWCRFWPYCLQHRHCCCWCFLRLDKEFGQRSSIVLLFWWAIIIIQEQLAQCQHAFKIVARFKVRGRLTKEARYLSLALAWSNRQSSSLHYKVLMMAAAVALTIVAADNC